MNRSIPPLTLAVISLCLFSAVNANKTVAQAPSDASGSGALRKLLTGAYSKKKIVETAADHNGSLLFHRWKTSPDTVHVVAIRIEFQKDTSPSTTGNGTFNILTSGDKKEVKFYNSDTVYKFDALPHDSAYFDNQLRFVRDYFAAVSHGNLYIDYSIFPPDPNKTNKAYALDSTMLAYGPGDKRKEETYAQYNNRINIKLLKFIRDALRRANAAAISPFAGLHFDKVSGNIVDSLGHRTVFLLIHAGSSYLTDGGKEGSQARDSPFDMIDAFITADYLKAYKDTLSLDSTGGVVVRGENNAPLLIDETMMVSETSNQDGLNFGIHGILVNQLARQLGIPDLYATSSGTTAIGAFCIMDFYGYSAGQGFIPPWPSAWVRAFMGWETPVVAVLGTTKTLNLKAACLGKPGDTTIALVPLNEHEYYLLENRQRSLVGGPGIFTYDTADNKTVSIDPTFPLNLRNNVSAQSTASRTILNVKNYDASLPASGVVVWHIDENVIKDRLRYNFLNADSSYRAVSMVEADGVNDIGFEFQSFYQLFFDVGGAEDLFPHQTINRKTALNKDSATTPVLPPITPGGKDFSFSVNAMGPWSQPSTHANDGGQTYLNLTFDTANVRGTELSFVHDAYYVKNYVDSVIKVTASWDYLCPGWPKRTVVDSGEALFDPAVCNIYKQTTGKEIVALSKKGRLYVWPVNADSSQPQWFGDTFGLAPLTGSINATLRNAPSAVASDTVSLDTVHFIQLRNPGRPYTFPTVINDNLFIPLLDTAVDIIKDLSKATHHGDARLGDIVPLRFQPSSYVCKLEGRFWAVGCSNGSIFFADTANYYSDTGTIILAADTPAAVCALAALPHEGDMAVCIQNSGVVSICSIKTKRVLASQKIARGIAPFTVVTGDINRNDTNEIVVCDSRKGLWAFSRGLTPLPGWESAPNDWASPYDTTRDRRALAVNTAAPALADLNGDGYLEIIVGGGNGLYALNYKGVLISGWPSYLDNRFYHGSVSCSPVVVSAPQGGKSPLVVFSSPSGENETFQIDRIVSANKKTGHIIFKRPDGSVDSTTATASFIDSAVKGGDSLIATAALYGGLVDAVDPTGKRPLRTIGSNQLFSRWPLTVGASIGASPLIDDIEGNGTAGLVAIAANGWVYRWKLDADMVGKTFIWKQTGYNGSRPFGYLAALDSSRLTESAPLTFFNYPNPTNGNKSVVFRYTFSAPAKNVRLDIFTYTGYHVFSKTGLSGSYPGDNELKDVSLANFGSGVYRCRMEAEVNGKKCVQFWKMAVVK